MYIGTTVIHISADAAVLGLPEHAVVAHLSYALMIGEPIGVISRPTTLVAVAEGAETAIDFKYIRPKIPWAVKDEILNLVCAHGIRVTREPIAVDK